MKNIALVSIILSITFLACKKDREENRNTICLPNTESDYPVDRGMTSLCTTDVCTNYLSIWKELIQEKNNLDLDFFDNHIKLHSTGINNWAKGISFTVCYEIQIDWAIAFNCDKFIIKIDSNNTHYPSVDLPRKVDLTKEEIELALENRAFASSIARINKTTEVISFSLEDALSDLIEFSNVNTLCFIQLSLNRDNGNLTLKALAQYENEDNLCISGTIDLITGEKNVLDNLCFI